MKQALHNIYCELDNWQIYSLLVRKPVSNPYKKRAFTKSATVEELKELAKAKQLISSWVTGRKRSPREHLWSIDPEKKKASRKRWVAKNARRVMLCKQASSKVNYALKIGVLMRPSLCQICEKSETRIEAAHFDYGKPLEVIWLCRKCHGRWDHIQPKTLSAQ